MSLLLDALKEAEARKREAAPAPAVAANTAATAARAAEMLEPSFESDGALALAEDYVPPSTPAPGLPPGGRSGSSTPLAPPEPFLQVSPAASAPAGAARPSSHASSATLTPAAADALLSSRPAQPTGPAAATGATAAPAAVAPPPAATTAPAATPAAATAAASLPRGALPAAMRATAASGAPRSPMRGLLFAAAGLALLLLAFVAYDQFVDVPTAPPPALPPQSVGAAPGAALDAPSAGATAASTGSLDMPVDGTPGRATAGAEFVVRAGDGVRDAAGSRAEAAPRRVPSREAPRAAPAADRAGAPGAPATASTPGLQISVTREPAPLEAAWAALQSGSLARAETLYRGVLESEPGQVDAQLGLAVIAQARGDDAAARRGFARVLESVPDHPRAWAGLAELSSEGEAGTIESRLRQLLADRPSAPLHFALGNLLARQQRWSDAQAEYFAAASLEPLAADYAFNVAVALERLDKPAAALPWYDKALAQAARGRAVRFDAAAVRARVSQLRAAPP